MQTSPILQFNGPGSIFKNARATSTCCIERNGKERLIGGVTRLRSLLCLVVRLKGALYSTYS